jgi:hypothetical protein
LAPAARRKCLIRLLSRPVHLSPGCPLLLFLLLRCCCRWDDDDAARSPEGGWNDYVTFVQSLQAACGEPPHEPCSYGQHALMHCCAQPCPTVWGTVLVSLKGYSCIAAAHVGLLLLCNKVCSL